MHQGREVRSLGQYFVVLKTFTVTRKAGHCIKDERLHVEGSILLLKNHCGKAARILHEEREVTDSRQYCTVKNRDFGRGRRDTA